ncbi:MAG: S1C family serine protease [Bacilli bacterium]
METGNEEKKLKEDETEVISDKVIDAEVVYEDNSDKKKSFTRNNEKSESLSQSVKKSDFLSKNIKYILLFVLGFVVAIIFVFCFKEVMFKSSTAQVELVDKGLNLGIKKVYDATVYIENYKNDKLSVSGTGFVYKKDSGKGYILTNYHVVNGSSSLKVSFSDDSKVDAKYVGGDQYLDIAIISVDDGAVKQVAELGSSTSAVLGDTVFTVGSPVGDEYRGTVTRGILSGKDRLVTVAVSGGVEDYVMKLLQTDAAMNPGNSGGPLCNVNGEVIGMNSLKLVKNEVEGMGFAISIEDIKGHLDTFEKGENIKRPYLGISMVNLENQEAMEYYGLSKKVDTKLEKGVVIEEVQSGTSADGKLMVGDIIIKLNGNSVDNMAYLRYELFKQEVGDKALFTVERDGKLVDVSINLKEK